MTGVVLRCPNCGTTGVAQGECAACHEAQVRYFCTNHEPGRWLDSPTCNTCGAVFGAKSSPPARPRAAPSSRVGTSTRPRSTRPLDAPSPGTSTRPSPGASSGASPDPYSGATRSPRREISRSDPADDEVPRGRPASLPELLIEIARERERRLTHDATSPERDVRRPDVVRRRPALGGCLIRAVMILLFIFLFFTGGFYSLFGGY